MTPFGGKLSVLVQKCRLDEELIDAACQLDNSCDIRGVESGVEHISNPMSTRGAQCMLLEFAESSTKLSMRNSSSSSNVPGGIGDHESSRRNAF